MFGLEIIVIFVVVWWLVLFTVLPFGIQKDDKIVGGNDPGDNWGGQRCIPINTDVGSCTPKSDCDGKKCCDTTKWHGNSNY